MEFGILIPGIPLPEKFQKEWDLISSKVRLLVSQKVIKWTKEGAILIEAILLIRRDSYFILTYLFGFIFTVL